MVVVLTLAAIVSGEIWMLGLLVYDCAARAVSLPGLSPMALLSERVILPVLRVRAGPSQDRSALEAEALGLAMSLASLGLQLSGQDTPYRLVLGALTLIAAAEAIFGLRTEPLIAKLMRSVRSLRG